MNAPGLDGAGRHSPPAQNGWAPLLVERFDRSEADAVSVDARIETGSGLIMPPKLAYAGYNS